MMIDTDILSFDLTKDHIAAAALQLALVKSNVSVL